jgi:hypothetical protein
MLATFCLRLACGLAAALLLLSPTQVAPRYYRTQFLTVLGLTAAAAVILRDAAGVGLGVILGASMFWAFLGSFVWSLEGAPAGRIMTILSVLTLAEALVLVQQALAPPDAAFMWSFINQLTSAALLGAAVSAMLMGHSYLIAPAMSTTPLIRLLQALFVTILLRMVVAGIGLWSWTADHTLGNLTDETLLWLPLRWGLGFVGPLVLGWMAWQSAKIRSTQSATGILYVVVIFCFLGELTSQLLQPTGHTL